MLAGGPGAGTGGGLEPPEAKFCDTPTLGTIAVSALQNFVSGGGGGPGSLRWTRHCGLPRRDGTGRHGEPGRCRAPKPALQPRNKVFAVVASCSEVLLGFFFFFSRLKIAQHLGIRGLFWCSQAGLAGGINVKVAGARCD